MGPRDSQENIPQSIILSPLACVWPAVYWGSNCLLRRRHILIQPLAWWMTNCDSSDQETLFHWSMDQLQYSWAHCKHSWWLCLVSRGTWVGCLLHSPHTQQRLLNSVLCYISTWPCIVLGCQLSHCLAPVLLHQAEQSPTTLFFDNP